MNGPNYVGRNKLKVALGSTAALCVFWPLGVANAQEVPEAQEPAEAATVGVTDIVVTARRRTEYAQEVPAALVAIGEEEILRKDLTNLHRLSSEVPGFRVAGPATGSGASIFLRGVGSTSSSIGIEQSVAVVVDGVYYGNGRVIKEGFFDAERIEVLKGPQALFYGKNATAGVVSITTKDPDDYFTGYVKTGFEVRSQKVTGAGAVSIPLNETMSVRLAAQASTMFDAYIHNRGTAQTYTTFDIARDRAPTVHPTPPGDPNPGERDFLGRATLKWEPTPDVTAKLTGSYNRNKIDNPAWNQIVYACPTGFLSRAPDTPCGRNFVTYDRSFAPDIAKDFLNAKDDGSLYADYEAYSITGSADYFLDEVTFSLISNYQWNHSIVWIDAVHQPQSQVGVFGTEDSTWRAYSTEFRVSTAFESPLNVLLGAYYQDTHRFLQGASAIGGAEDSSASPLNRYVTVAKRSETDGKTLSGFGQAIWDLGSEVELSAGVRYLHETKDSYYLQPYANAARVATGSFLVGVPVTADQTFDNWSPEITASWSPTPGINTFVAFRTGFKSGGFSNSSNFSKRSTVDQLAFGPETARAFEAGVKTNLFRNSLKFNLIAYTMKFSDLQIDFYDSANQSFTTTNAGAARSQGVDLELAWAPAAIEGFRAYSNVAYNRTRYQDYIAPCYAGQTIAMGCSLVSANGVPRQDLSGAAPANAPNWTGSTGFAYDIPVGGTYLVGLSGDANFSSDYTASFFNQPLAQQDGYVTFDAAVRVGPEDGPWTISLVGKNLTNKFIVVGSFDNSGTGGPSGGVTGVLADQQGPVMLPRTVEIQGMWRF